MTSIVLCEKPSQARNVQAAVGTRYGRVLALRGHVLRLAEPHEVNEAWKNWSFALLRPEGGFYPLRPDPSHGKGEILDQLEAALTTADRVVIATDCDREGQAIGEHVLRFFKFRGEVLRAMFNAEDEETLRQAFAAMRPNADYLPLYQSAVARQQLDQIANLSATRAVTLALKPEGMRGAMGVGRVKTPTMAIVCRRQLEIDAFRPRAYFDLWADVAHAGETVRLFHRPKDEARIYVEAVAGQLVAPLAGWTGPVRVLTERKRQSPPKLPHLSALQAKAARWGWSAKKTLEVAQALYETHKVTTYPRADNRYLPEAEIANAPAMLAGLAALPFGQVGYGAPTIRKGKAGHFSDAALAGSSHHAIIPNPRAIDRWPAALAAMDTDERRLFENIARAYLAAIGPDREYDRTEISIEPASGRKFAVVGIVERSAGWRAAMGIADEKGEGEEDDEARALPAWPDGADGEITDAGVDQKMTKPPAPYTEGSLIVAMEQAWRFAEDPAMAERLKEAKGIGTPATRDSIIDGLKKQGFFAVEKGGQLRATPLALGLYHELMKQDCRDWLDPASTAEMELALDQIMIGTVQPRAVIDQILTRTERLIACMEGQAAAGGPLAVQVKQPPSKALLDAAKAKAKRQGVKLLRGATADAALCREFLGPRVEGGAPTEGQVKYAREIAAAIGLELPVELAGDRRALSAWIDQHKDRVPKDDAPTAKQIAFAEKIAGEKGIELADGTRRSRAALSKWIDAHAPSGHAPKAGEKTKKARGRTPGRSRVARQLRWDAP